MIKLNWIKTIGVEMNELEYLASKKSKDAFVNYLRLVFIIKTVFL